MSRKALKSICVALVLMTLFSVVLVSLPIQKVIAMPTISSITPSQGFVGDTVEVNGTIDTPDGFFTVRWNQTLNITTGQAKGVNVNANFSVPQTVGAPSPLGRNVTIELIDDNARTVSTPPLNFTLYTKFYMQLSTVLPLRRVMEGQSVNILVNVTGGEPNTIYAANITVKDPANQTRSKVIPFSNTTTTGYGWSGISYPSADFGAGPHTNYTGKYLVTFNETIAPPEAFFVGLTDKPEYRRGETVQIRAAGYSPSEVAKIDIKTAGSSLTNFPRNATATSYGIVLFMWDVPIDAALGTYTVTVTNTTAGGTVKPIKDVQDFRILGAVCQVQTKNLADEKVVGVTVEVYNSTNLDTPVLNGNTNSTGWIKFNLDLGNYTFKAFYKNVQVGTSSKNITEDTDFDLQLSLVNVVATVKTESGERIPLIDIALKYNYTQRDNTTLSATASMLTNLTGMAETHNLFTNKTYRVEATRSDLLFNSTTFHIGLTPSSPVSLEFTLPTFTLNVHALDSQNKPVSEVQIRIFEWTAGVTTPIQSSQTNGNGNVSFSLLFGRYRVRVFKGDVFLNETIVNLIENPTALALNLITVNVTVNVFVSDYFGQPIANAEVKIEREIDQENVLVGSQFTGGNGLALFTLSIGGDSRISVFVSGRLVAVNTQFLDRGPNRVAFRIGEYVAILGYPIETGAFSLVSFIIVLVVLFIVTVRRRFTQVFRRRRKG